MRACLKLLTILLVSILIMHTKAGAQTASGEGMYAWDPDSVTVYASPDHDSGVLYKIAYGERVQLNMPEETGKPFFGDSGNPFHQALNTHWVRITYKGRSGYTAAHLISDKEPMIFNGPAPEPIGEYLRRTLLEAGKETRSNKTGRATVVTDSVGFDNGSFHVKTMGDCTADVFYLTSYTFAEAYNLLYTGTYYIMQTPDGEMRMGADFSGRLLGKYMFKDSFGKSGLFIDPGDNGSHTLAYYSCS